MPPGRIYFCLPLARVDIGVISILQTVFLLPFLSTGVRSIHIPLIQRPAPLITIYT